MALSEWTLPLASRPVSGQETLVTPVMPLSGRLTREGPWGVEGDGRHTGFPDVAGGTDRLCMAPPGHREVRSPDPSFWGLHRPGFSMIPAISPLGWRWLRGRGSRAESRLRVLRGFTSGPAALEINGPG